MPAASCIQDSWPPGLPRGQLRTLGRVSAPRFLLSLVFVRITPGASLTVLVEIEQAGRFPGVLGFAPWQGFNLALQVLPNTPAWNQLEMQFFRPHPEFLDQKPHQTTSILEVLIKHKWGQVKRNHHPQPAETGKEASDWRSASD